MDLYDDLQGLDGTLSTQHDSAEVQMRRLKQEDEMALVRQGLAHCKQQNSKLLRKCSMLEKNLSCLYKTAWAHLHRKDEYIEALKSQIKEFRRLTGMVAPGVHPDGQLTDVHDGNIADAGEEMANKRPRQEQNERRAEELRCHEQSKQPRTDHAMKAATQELSVIGDSGASRAQNSGSMSDRETRMGASAAFQSHIPATKCPPAGEVARGFRSHAASQANASVWGTQRPHHLNGSDRIRHHGLTSRLHVCNHAFPGRSRHGTASRSPPAEGGRQRARSAQVDRDNRSAESPRALKPSSVADYLRCKPGHDYRSSGGSPRRRK